MPRITSLPRVAFDPREGVTVSLGTRRWQMVCATPPRPGDTCARSPVARGTIPLRQTFPATAKAQPADAAIAASPLAAWRAPATTGPGRILAEDGTTRAGSLEMAYEPGDPASLPLIDTMAQIAAETGTRLVVVAKDVQGALSAWLTALSPEVRRLVTVVAVPHPVTAWTQDSGEARSDGSIVVPPSLRGQIDIERVVQTDRLKRRVDLSFFAMGTMDRTEAARTRLGSALALGLPAYAGKAYSEGGNVVVGTDAQGRQYALVGQDTLAVNRAWLSKQAGRPASDADVLAALASDFGLATDRVIPVEQPGDFHLDMRMMALPGGHVLLNDAPAAFALQRQWLLEDHAAKAPPADSPTRAAWLEQGSALQRTLAEMGRQAEREGELESRTAQDLQAAGLTVHRLAGTFPAVHQDVPAAGLVDGGITRKQALPPMDFFNTAQWTTADGERVAVMLGGDPRAEALVRQQWLTALPTPWERVYFLDPGASASSLGRFGGIQCRIKALATVPAKN